MADKKITALTAETDIDSDDLAHIVTDVSTSATNKKITIANVFNKIPTFIGYGADSVETVTADGALSTTKAISILSASGTTTVQTTLADVTQVGFTKHIIRAGTSSGTHDVDLTTKVGDIDTIALDEAGSTVTLMWSGTSGWVLLASAPGTAGQTDDGITTTT